MYRHSILITLNSGTTAHREYMIKFEGWVSGSVTKDLKLIEILEWLPEHEKWEDAGVGAFRARAVLTDALEMLKCK